MLALGVPLASLARWLVRGSLARPSRRATCRAATVTTLGLAVAGGVLATVAALPVAWLAVRYRGVLSTVVERSVYPANALPGIVVALALVTISIHSVPALYQTVPLLLLGYAILFLPRAVVERAGHARAGAARPRGRGPVARVHRPRRPRAG